MLDVLLVRHAIAADRDSSAWPDDSLRPLTERGERRFRPAARGLRTIVASVDAILASPYVRAWRTAELLHEEAHWPAPERCEALEAERSPADALAVLTAEGSVALVGHEPFLSSFASLLLTGDEAAARLELKKGGAALLSFDSSAAPGEATLRWHLPPKILRALDGASDGAGT
jgi:phosphohistidine phosphatase